MDEAVVTFRGGHGGPGIVSFGPLEGSGPDGGNGGRGGDFYIKVTSDITLLNQFRTQTSFEAGRGFPGGKNKKTGKDGVDFDILLPVGSTIADAETGRVLMELNQVDERILFLKGGRGGRGNWEFRSPRRTTPEFAQPGEDGEFRTVKIILKLIASYGLIGLPNAGKSSLLNELTNANAKIGSYAFTTLFPNLGVYKGKILADIPGLIEGASEGKGLGIAFLKHIEKVEVLLHCIAADSTDLEADYVTVRNELGKYNKELLNKKEVILLTKSDLVDKSEITKSIKVLKKHSKTVITVSIHDWESLESLKKLIK